VNRLVTDSAGSGGRVSTGGYQSQRHRCQRRHLKNAARYISRLFPVVGGGRFDHHGNRTAHGCINQGRVKPLGTTTRWRRRITVQVATQQREKPGCPRLPLRSVACPKANTPGISGALIASTVGTTIERYDFLLYGTVTGLVFGKLFFLGSEPLIGVLQAFGVFFIGFVGRPIGAAIFGHFGDRIGRKATLTTTLLPTGIATVAVGLVPTYNSIGIWGAVLLTFIRLIQGIGVGGEMGRLGVAGDGMEQREPQSGQIASIRRPGRSVPGQWVLLFSWLSGDQFLVWGSRIPFLISIVMVGVGLWIRMGILETPVFQKIYT
jgi:hypothetical protein